jgi:hypothetical protein
MDIFLPPGSSRARFKRTRRALTRAFAGGMLLTGVPQAHAGTVVTNRVVSQTTQTQTSIPVTFGQVFKAGDVPRGTTLEATLGGKQVMLQVDAKATNPDGSLRHAVLTAMVPELPKHARLPLALSTAPAASDPGNPVRLSQLLATQYDAKASLDISGNRYTADARALLQTAQSADACRPWNRQCDLWLSGPLVSAWVVNGPLTSSTGVTNPNLRVYFAVRAYAGTTPGTVGYVRTDIIVENSNAFAPQAQPQYTATLTSGSASYTSPALTQYAYTRWHKVLWWNNAQPQVYLQQDTQYIQNSMAVSRYMALTPDQAFLNSVRQSCTPLDHCDQTQKMADTGAQASIGPLPRWTSVYILDPDVRAYNWMLANTDALGAYSIHYRDAATGFPVSIRRHPYVTTIAWTDANANAKRDSVDGRKFKAALLPSCVNNAVVTGCDRAWYVTGNPNVWDNAHQPAESYVPYMVTGDYYYMSELAFGASHNELWSNPGYRGYSKGLIDRAHGQIRGKAWTLREMADAAWLLPDSHPLKTEFTADVENSLADWNAKYTHNPAANPLHVFDDSVMADLNGGHRNGLSPWQHNFMVWSAGHAAELGFAGARAFRDWLAPFEIGMMTDWQGNAEHGYCWLEASMYQIQVKDAAGNWLPNLTTVYAASFPTLSGLACNSPAMVAAMGKLEKQPWKAGQMHGYAYSPTGFPANLQIGLASAVDGGLPHAMDAWRVFESRSVKPAPPHGYNNFPNFAVIPRGDPR